MLAMDLFAKEARTRSDLCPVRESRRQFRLDRFVLKLNMKYASLVTGSRPIMKALPTLHNLFAKLVKYRPAP